MRARSTEVYRGSSSRYRDESTPLLVKALVELNGLTKDVFPRSKDEETRAPTRRAPHEVDEPTIFVLRESLGEGSPPEKIVVEEDLFCAIVQDVPSFLDISRDLDRLVSVEDGICDQHPREGLSSRSWHTRNDEHVLVAELGPAPHRISGPARSGGSPAQSRREALGFGGSSRHSSAQPAESHQLSQSLTWRRSTSGMLIQETLEIVGAKHIALAFDPRR